MAILKRNTRAALDAARSDHTKTEARIGELHKQKQAALSDDADIDVLLALDKQPTDESGKLVALGAKIEILSKRLDGEDAAEHERKRHAAVNKVERLLPEHVADAQRFEDWIRAGVPLLEKMAHSSSKIAADWPDELPQPFAFYFADVANCLRVLDRIFAKLGARQSNSIADVKERVADVDGFAAMTRRRLDELLESLRLPAATDEEIAA